MFLNLTGKEYLQFVSELYNQKEKFDELLAIYIPKLKLENSLEQTISSYSLGMKQKYILQELSCQMLKTLFWTNRLMRLTQKVLPLSKKYYLI